MNNKDSKIQQSNSIATLGCIGGLLLLILAILIAGVAIKSDLNKKKATALQSASLIREQIEKAPGILDRMLDFDCGSMAGDSVAHVKTEITNLSPDATMTELNTIWSHVESAWTDTSRGCVSHLNEEAFQGLTIEMEGIRNRRSVELGNYRRAAEIYNSALAAFPSNLLAYDMKPLDVVLE